MMFNVKRNCRGEYFIHSEGLLVEILSKKDMPASMHDVDSICPPDHDTKVKQ